MDTYIWVLYIIRNSQFNNSGPAVKVFDNKLDAIKYYNKFSDRCESYRTKTGKYTNLPERKKLVKTKTKSFSVDYRRGWLDRDKQKDLEHNSCIGCEFDYVISNYDEDGNKLEDIFPDACYSCKRNNKQIDNFILKIKT
jgi:hypothetical protein